MMRAILLAFVLTGGALAQAPAAKVDPRTMAPTVSDLDRAKIENLSLKISILEREIGDFVSKFEHEYPGWSVNVKTQQVYQKPEETTPAPPTSKK